MGSPQYINTARQYTITRTFLYLWLLKVHLGLKSSCNTVISTLCLFVNSVFFLLSSLMSFFCFFAGIETSNDGCIKERRNPDTWIYR